MVITRDTPIRPLPAPALASNYGNNGNPASAWPTGITISVSVAEFTWTYQATVRGHRPITAASSNPGGAQ